MSLTCILSSGLRLFRPTRKRLTATMRRRLRNPFVHSVFLRRDKPNALHKLGLHQECFPSLNRVLARLAIRDLQYFDVHAIVGTAGCVSAKIAPSRGRLKWFPKPTTSRKRLLLAYARPVTGFVTTSEARFSMQIWIKSLLFMRLEM